MGITPAMITTLNHWPLLATTEPRSCRASSPDRRRGLTSDELVQVQFTAETFNALATLHRDCSDCETAGGSTHAQTFPTANRVIVLSAAAIAILTGRIPPIGVRVSPNSTGGPDELRAQEDACCCSVEASPSALRWSKSSPIRETGQQHRT